MEVTINESEIVVCGVMLDVEAECSITYIDDSFSHEFGVEKCGHWEIESIYNLCCLDIRDSVLAELKNRGLHNHNRRFKKQLRQLIRRVEKALNSLDPDDIFSESAKDAAVETACNQEPDYGEPDRDDD